MIRQFKVRNSIYSNEILGTLYLDTVTEEYKLLVLKDYSKLHPDYFLRWWAEHGISEVSGAEIQHWIQRRILPPNRHGINGFLDFIGIKEYNVSKIIDYTKGICVMDDLWFEEV